jgi:hypothetical protein
MGAVARDKTITAAKARARPVPDDAGVLFGVVDSGGADDGDDDDGG